MWLLILALLLAACAGPAQANAYRLLIQSSALPEVEEGGFSLASVRIDGSARTILTEDSTTWMDAVSWSPDGRKILAFDPARGILVMNSDGSGRQVILPGEHYDSMAWSPAGDRIAGVRNGSGGWQIDLFAPDGSKRETLISGTEGLPSMISWSPDGTSIAYLYYDHLMATPAYDQDKQVRVVDAATGEVHPVVILPKGTLSSQVSWGQGQEDVICLSILNLPEDGSSELPGTTTHLFQKNGLLVKSFANMYLYTCEIEGGRMVVEDKSDGQLKEITLADGAMRPLALTLPQDAYPSFSFDGNWAAYAGPAGAPVITVVNLNTSEEVKIPLQLEENFRFSGYSFSPVPLP